MEEATSEELQKINTMKLIVTFFITKLDDFIDKTSVADKDLLMLLSRLTESIEDFVCEAKVLETHHTIDLANDHSYYDTSFECLACNLQMGKTYASVVNHASTLRHLINAMQFEEQQKTPPLNNTSSSTCPVSGPLPMPNFPPKNDFEMNSLFANDPTWNNIISTVNPSTVPNTMPNSPSPNGFPINPNLGSQDAKNMLPPFPYNPFPLLPIELSNYLQQHRPLVPPPLLPMQPPFLGPAMNPCHGNGAFTSGSSHNAPHGLHMNQGQGNRFLPFGSNNNAPHGLPAQRSGVFTFNTSGHGSSNHYNRGPPTGDYNQNRGTFNPSPYIGGANNQQMNVTTASNIPPNFNQTKKGPVQPVVESKRKNRKIKKNAALAVNFGAVQAVKDDVTFLNSKTEAFLRKDFERLVMKYLHDAQILTDEALYDDITDNLIDCCKQMSSHFTAEVQCYGSRINGVGMYHSDVDLNISVHDCVLSSDTFLKRLEEVLSSNTSWTNVSYIRSRVSLIRARFGDELDCHITFNNDHAMTNTQLIKYFYRIQPDCHKLAVFLRLLTQKAKIYPFINMYTLNLLVYLYFQHVGYLPKVVDLIDKSLTEYWPTNFAEKSLEELNIKLNGEKFIDLCIGLMDFYANHVDFEGSVLSVFTGSSIPKTLFATHEYQKTNDCYEGLLRYMDNDPAAAEAIRSNFQVGMCVQDPFAHDHNVCRCVTGPTLKRFRDCCRETRHMLLKRSQFADSSVVEDSAAVENSFDLEESLAIRNINVFDKRTALGNRNSTAFESNAALENSSVLHNTSVLAGSAIVGSDLPSSDGNSALEDNSTTEHVLVLKNTPAMESNPALENSSTSEYNTASELHTTPESNTASGSNSASDCSPASDSNSASKGNRASYSNTVIKINFAPVINTASESRTNSDSNPTSGSNIALENNTASESSSA